MFGTVSASCDFAIRQTVAGSLALGVHGEKTSLEGKQYCTRKAVQTRVNPMKMNGLMYGLNILKRRYVLYKCHRGHLDEGSSNSHGGEPLPIRRPNTELTWLRFETTLNS